MNVFAKIIGINILIYGVYIILLLSNKSLVAAAILIVIHSILLIVFGASIRAKAPPFTPEQINESELQHYEQQIQKRQAFIISGLLVLLIGMPACFILGASNFKIN